MKSRLTYRIPGEGVVVSSGDFVPINDLSGVDGFIVSDFEGHHYYRFQEGDTSDRTAIWPEMPHVISKENYLFRAEAFIADLKARNMGKAILSRVHKSAMQDMQPEAWFALLEAAYPSAFCYLLESELLGTWIGATPEKLLFMDQAVGSTMALAGTRRSDESVGWEEKEQREQGLVADYIQHVLQRHAKNVHVSERRELIAGPVKHLVHEFEFELVNWPDPAFLSALHPTPAVSGFPKAAALELIRETEDHERRLYAGVIGLIGMNRTRLFVNLRCAQIIESTGYLYVGGGLTPQSNPESEWVETENKARTLLNVWQNK